MAKSTIKIWTLQVGSWRLARDKGIPYFDITVRTGIKAFAPTWDMVSSYKAGALSEADYTSAYKQLMRKSIVSHQKYWDELNDVPEFAIMCYCPPGSFCHRLLLAQYLKAYLESKFDTEVVLMGELTKQTA